MTQTAATIQARDDKGRFDRTHNSPEVAITASAVDVARVPSHCNDIGDWCPFSGEKHPGGECPQGCAEARDEDAYDEDFDDD